MNPPTDRSFARTLRRQMTDVEKQLWRQLRDRRLQGLKFRRQVPLGRYVADFACFEQGLIVELDGGQHAEQVRHDAERDQWLHQQGFRVLRFWNNEVTQNLEGVLTTIVQACACTPSSPTLLPQGEKGEGQPAASCGRKPLRPATPHPAPLAGEEPEIRGNPPP